MSSDTSRTSRRQLAPAPAHYLAMMSLHNLGVQTCSPSDSRSGAGAGALPIGFIDAWLRDEMERCYGRVLEEPLPVELLALLADEHGPH